MYIKNVARLNVSAGAKPLLLTWNSGFTVQHTKTNYKKSLERFNLSDQYKVEKQETKPQTGRGKIFIQLYNEKKAQSADLRVLGCRCLKLL